MPKKNFEYEYMHILEAVKRAQYPLVHDDLTLHPLQRTTFTNLMLEKWGDRAFHGKNMPVIFLPHPAGDLILEPSVWKPGWEYGASYQPLFTNYASQDHWTWTFDEWKGDRPRLHEALDNYAFCSYSGDYRWDPGDPVPSDFEVLDLGGIMVGANLDEYFTSLTKKHRWKMKDALKESERFKKVVKDSVTTEEIDWMLKHSKIIRAREDENLQSDTHRVADGVFWWSVVGSALGLVKWIVFSEHDRVKGIASFSKHGDTWMFQSNVHDTEEPVSNIGRMLVLHMLIHVLAQPQKTKFLEILAEKDSEGPYLYKSAMSNYWYKSPYDLVQSQRKHHLRIKRPFLPNYVP